MQAGSTELTRAVTTYLAALGFALAFLLSTALGASLGTSLLRGILVAAGTRIAAPWLVRPVLATVLDAIARDARPPATDEGDA